MYGSFAYGQGYYGLYSLVANPPSAVPDPCRINLTGEYEPSLNFVGEYETVLGVVGEYETVIDILGEHCPVE